MVSIFTTLFALLLFHACGNGVRGYIDSPSLLVWWFGQWINPQAQCEHGFFVLILGIWLLWHNLKKDAAQTNIPRTGTGLFLITAAVLLHLFGLALQQTRISIVAFLLFLNGSAYLLGGQRWGQASRLPCAFMLFSMPLGFLFDEFGFHLRLSVIETATAISHLLGLDVIRNGTQLSTPDGHYHYDVAPACSGIRSLSALVALSTLLGCLQFRSWWRRGIFVILAFPFAWLGNIVRILTIIVAAHVFGQEAGSIVHEWFGFLVFLIVLGMAILTSFLLEKYLPETQLSPCQQASGAKVTSISWKNTSLTLLLIAAVSLPTAKHLLSSMPIGETALRLNIQGHPITLPLFLNTEWMGRHTDISPTEREILPEDTGVSKTLYHSLDDPRKSVLISTILSGADRSSIHRPELCLVGQGWTIVGREQLTLPIDGFPQGIPVTLLHTARQTNGQEEPVPGLFLYFFVGSDVIIPTHHGRMLHAAFEQVLRQRRHRWAYIFAQTDCTDGEAEGMQRIQSLLQHTLPQLLDFERLRIE